MHDFFILGQLAEINDSFDRSVTELNSLSGANTGNFAFSFAIRKLLGGGLPTTVPWSATAEEINAPNENLGIIPCANQIGPHADMGGFGDKLSKVTKRIVAVGLGAQGSALYDDDIAIPPGTLRWIAEIVKRSPTGAPNISVRGEFTRSVLAKHGFEQNVVSIGCPSLLISDKQDLGEQLQERYRLPFNRVAVAAGHPNWKPLANIERSLVRIMEATKGDYIVQATWEQLALARAEDQKVSDEFITQFRRYVCPQMDDAEFTTWRRRYMKAFYHVPSWIEYLRSFDLVVGSRIHGVMMAIQAGVPGLCIAHDSRVRELCEISQIPYVLAKDIPSGLNRDDIPHMFSFDGRSFDQNRKALREAYNQFYRSNGLRMSSSLIAAG